MGPSRDGVGRRTIINREASCNTRELDGVRNCGGRQQGDRTSREVGELRRRINEYKIQTQDLKIELDNQKVLNSAASDLVVNLRETVGRLQQEIDTMRSVSNKTEPLAQDRGVTPRPKPTRYKVDIALRLLGIASFVEQAVLGLCHRETMELIPTETKNIREWMGVSSIVTTLGYREGV